MTDKKTCAQLVRSELRSRMKDLRGVWTAYCAGDTEQFNEYGLSLEYVEWDAED